MNKKGDRNPHKTTSLLAIDDLLVLNEYVSDGKKVDSEEQVVEGTIEEKSSETKEQVKEVVPESGDSSTEPEKTIRSFNIPEGSLMIRDKEDQEALEKKRANGPGKLTGFFGAAVLVQKEKVKVQKAKAAKKKEKKDRGIKKLNENNEE